MEFTNLLVIMVVAFLAPLEIVAAVQIGERLGAPAPASGAALIAAGLVPADRSVTRGWFAGPGPVGTLQGHPYGGVRVAHRRRWHTIPRRRAR